MPASSPASSPAFSPASSPSFADDVSRPNARPRAAVLGSPIAHSLSPVLHRAAYAQMGLDWSYEAIECDEAHLPALLDGLDGLDESFVGLSLTMPLKRAVLPLLDEISPLARAVGAANTVRFGSGSDRPAGRRARLGDNTDVGGMVAAIREAGVERARRIVVLGAGGTAAAALAAARELGRSDAGPSAANLSAANLSEAGPDEVRAKAESAANATGPSEAVPSEAVPSEVDVVVRNRDRAADLLAAAQRLGVRVRLRDWPGAAVLREADLVISTVPAGAADAVAAEWVPRASQAVFDVVYEPWPTRLAAVADDARATVVGGLDLLVHQAAGQIALWAGRPAPVDAMRAAGEQALKARATTA